MSPRIAATFLAALLIPLLPLPLLAATVTLKVVDPSGQPVADAVVYAQPAAGTPMPSRAPRAVSIEQVDREFVPYVQPVQVGTVVSFPNRDMIAHHVYSFSPVKSFEIKLYTGDAPRGIAFDRPGEVILGCNIHDWMIGYVLVLDTPWFARVDGQGRATLADLPAGSFELRAWHPTQRAPAAAKPVTLDARAAADHVFTLDAAPRKKRFKPPLDGVRYR